MHLPKYTQVLPLVVVFLLAACATSTRHTASTTTHVLFVCEHGHVKSLMAASYFNELAQERHLPYEAISRGSAPDSTTVPPGIVEELRNEGFSVAEFRPLAVTSSDMIASRQVVLIGTDLPTTVQASDADTERWLDVPPASTDYAAARDSLRSHVSQLMDKLLQTEGR